MNQEWDESLLKDYIEDDFLIDAEIDEGVKPDGDYAILSVEEWQDWYYGEENDTINEKSLQLLDQLEIDLLLDSVDYGLNQPTGLYDGQVLTTMQLNIGSLDDIKKGFDHVSQNNIVFLYSIAKHPKRIIPMIPTKANPQKEQIVPEYYKVQWAKLDNNYDQQL